MAQDVAKFDHCTETATYAAKALVVRRRESSREAFRTSNMNGAGKLLHPKATRHTGNLGPKNPERETGSCQAQHVVEVEELSVQITDHGDLCICVRGPGRLTVWVPSWHFDSDRSQLFAA